MAKPACTRTEPDGRITSRGHASRGAIQARVLLWRMGLDFELREAVAMLVLTHMVPLFLSERSNPERTVILLSQSVRCDLLAQLATADIEGRHCADAADKLATIELFADQCRSLGCLDGAFFFENERHDSSTLAAKDAHPTHRHMMTRAAR